MRDHRGSVLKQSLLRFVRRGAWSHAERLVSGSHPADVADVLDRLTDSERRAVFDLLRKPELQSEVLALLDAPVRAGLLAELSPEIVARFLEQMSTDDAAEVLRQIPRELSDQILGALGERAKPIESLLDYPEETAGAIMTPEYIALPEDLTAAQAIQKLQSLGQAEASFYVYVVDERHHLVGVLSLRQLITQHPSTQLRDTMVRDPIRVTTDTDQEDVARIVARYDLLAVPVVDRSSQLVGVITVDDVLDVMQEEATENILKLAGTTAEEVQSPGIFRVARIRMPWLAASFVGGALGILILKRSEAVLAEAVQLTFFLPIILAMAGNVASQCSMVMVQGLALDRVAFGSIGRVLLHEIGTSVLLAPLFAASVGGFAVVLGGQDPLFPWVVGGAMFLAMLVSAALGTLLPLCFRAMGADPAVASGPFVTTSSDVLAISIFLGSAMLCL